MARGEIELGGAGRSGTEPGALEAFVAGFLAVAPEGVAAGVGAAECRMGPGGGGRLIGDVAVAPCPASDLPQPGWGQTVARSGTARWQAGHVFNFAPFSRLPRRISPRSWSLP
jgi:hypothetical protein